MSAIFKLFHFYAQVAVAAILSLISGNARLFAHRWLVEPEGLTTSDRYFATEQSWLVLFGLYPDQGFNYRHAKKINNNNCLTRWYSDLFTRRHSFKYTNLNHGNVIVITFPDITSKIKKLGSIFSSFSGHLSCIHSSCS